MKHNIDFTELLKELNKQYHFLYEKRDDVEGYRETVLAGVEFISENIEFIREFVAFRGDVLSSDREVAALMYALKETGALEDGAELEAAAA